MPHQVTPEDIRNDEVSRYWAHSSFVFCLSGMVSRVLKMAVTAKIIGLEIGVIFGLVALATALIYWLFWVLSEINEVIPRENHHNLFIRRGFSWSYLVSHANLFELAYRLLVGLSIVLGALISAIY